MILFTLAFMACVAAIGLVARFAVATEMEAQARRGVEAEADALADEFAQGGRLDLDAALAGRLRNGENPYRYSLDAERTGPDPLPVGSVRDNPAPHAISVARTLGDGTGLTVSDDLARAAAVLRTIDRAFLSALAVAAVLGLCTGALLSGTLLGRLDRVTRAADAVAAGNLALRMPLKGTGDEFDRLAGTLNRMLDRIVGLMGNLQQVSNDVAHDLRTPMSRLRQGLETARRKGTTVGDFRIAVDRALSDVDGILDIFAALLRIAQVESGSRRAGFQIMSLSEAVEDVAETYRVAAEDEGKALATDIASGIAVHGDRELLFQLLANLVENALQHTPMGCRITIGAASSSGTASAWVADDGPGIPAAERDRVLRRFHRLDGSRSGEGHGLGLSLVAAVVDLHGGSLTLSDNTPGLRVEVRLSSAEMGRGPAGPPGD